MKSASSPPVTDPNAQELRRVIAELALRKIEGLKLYRPMPFQEAFHASYAPERIIRGGNRCLDGSQEIYDPVVGRSRRIDSIGEEFHVVSMNPETGKLETKKASAPFVKGRGEMFEYALSNGSVIRATAEHRVLDSRGRWISLGESWHSGKFLLISDAYHPQSNSGIARLARASDDPSFLQTIRGYRFDCPALFRSCDERLPLDREAVQCSLPSQADALGRSQRYLPQRDRDGKSACSRPYQSSFRLSTSHDAQGTEGHASFAGYRSDLELPLSSSRLCEKSSISRRSSSFDRCTVPEADRREYQGAGCEFCSSHPQKFVVGENQSATIVAAKPLGVRSIWDISVDDWSNYTCAGLVNANSGKTCAAAAEVARAITGTDPYLKYPLNDGICYVVGKQGKEVAQVLFPLIFRPGAFKIIRDLYTKEWRTYDPTSPSDIARKSEAKKAPPFVPKRMVASIAWEDKKRDLPSLITMTNGWRVYFYSSEGKPTQGTAIDLVHLDEEILNEEWYTETSARLIDKGGRFIWSATPQAGTEKLFALHERAEDQVEKKTYPPTVEEFFCTIVGNKYMADEDRELFIAKHVEDENTYNVRVLGGFAMLSGRVYPEYTPRKYEIDPFEIPADWTRYVAVDPGRQICAVLFGAVPPPERGDFFYIYDELYIKDCTAAIFGQEMGRKAGNQTFHTFLIDMSDAKRHETGTGLKIVTQYSEQLKANRVSSELTGNEFETGNSDVRSGIEAVRHWLRNRSDDTHKIQVFRTCRNLSKEMMHYRNQQIKVQGQFQFIDKPVKKRDHLVDTLRYLVQRNPEWVKPKLGKGRAIGAYAAYLRMNKQAEEKGRMNGGGSTLVLGPQQYAD